MKHTREALSLLVAMIVSMTALSQLSGTIKGKVLDPDGLPVIGAFVQVDQGTVQLSTVSDTEGRFTLKPLPSGSYSVTISFLSYRTLQFDNVSVFPEQITFLPETRMAFESVVVGGNGNGPVVTTLTKPLIRPDQPGMTTILASELKNSPVRRDLAQAAAATNSNIIVEQTENGTNLYFRGSRSGDNLYILDGMKLTQNIPRIPAAGIASMNVYTGGVPAKYGDFTGGVVVIETRSFNEIWKKIAARQAVIDAANESTE